MKMFANKQNPIDFIEAGDIGAAVGFKEIKTGDTLCDENHPIVLENMFIPEPVISIAVEPKAQVDVDKMGLAISKLVEEDPTLRVKTDEETGQTILSGMGELHLDIYVERTRREYKVDVNVGAPKGASRLLQRIGRANHRYDEPSRAILVPANRFEVLECRAAIDAATAEPPAVR